MKIALVAFRLSGGGSDRVMANLSKFFSKNGCDVHIIIFHDELGYDYSGTVFNLGKLKSESNTIFNKIKRFYHFNKYIKKQEFDFIIDFRFRVNPIQELLIAKYIYNAKTAFTVHSSTLNEYMSNLTLLTKWTYGSCYKMIAITNAMQQSILDLHGLSNVETIYNPVDIKEISKRSKESIELDFDYIIGVGHFNTNQKQFDKLISAYSKSILPEKNIALVILGEGKNEIKLKQIASNNNVENLVHFLGFKSNPYKYIAKSKFFVLSSKFEGLPMVLLEALSCGIPVVAFDCPTGPREVISHRENGLLIENQNIEALIAGINDMTTDIDLYAHCKMNSQKSVEKFSVDVIGKQWLELMNFKFN